MGCCLGTTTAINHPHPPKTSQSPPQPPPPPPPPPPPLEEETVKEVLSEIPIVPKTQQPLEEQHKTQNPTVETQENVSEISEMYTTYSESFSAATTATLADTKKDEIDDGEVTQKVNNNSPPPKRLPRKRPTASSGELAARKERATRPLARRQPPHSTERKRQSPSTTATNARYRNMGASNDGRKEVSARRSRSPAVRGERCQRREVRQKSGEVLPANAIGSEGKSRVEMADDGGVSPELGPPASESLENPLVSLECFIFL